MGGGGGFWFAVELQAVKALGARREMGSMEDELLGVVFCWAGVVDSAVGLAHVEVPLRLTEPDFIKKKPPLS